MSNPFISASFFHGIRGKFRASNVAGNTSSPILPPDHCVDFVKSSFLPLNTRFFEDFLNDGFVSVCSPCASEF